MMQRIKYFLAAILFSAFLISSCAKKQIIIPPDIIPKEKMVELLVDFHLAESLAQSQVMFDDAKKLKQEYYKFIFEKHQVDYIEFKKSIAFYSANPALFTEIYESAVTELSKKQAETSGEIKSP